MIIGIVGKKGSGKDTVADFICDKYNFKKISFADPIKEALKIIFGWNDSYLYTEKKNIVDDNYGVSPRKAMQTLGTDWGQTILCDAGEDFLKTTGRNLWVKRTLKNISIFDNIIISDVRFLHEAEAIEKEGGFLIKITRELASFDSHKSEAEVDKIKNCVEIFNNYDLNTLFKNIDKVYSSLFKHSIPHT